jgi:hypothetical protein
MKEKASGGPACVATGRNRSVVQTARFSYAGVDVGYCQVVG